MSSTKAAIAKEKAKSKPVLTEDYQKALHQAQMSVRSEAPTIRGKIQDIFELGFDNRPDTSPLKENPEQWIPIQPVVVDVEIADAEIQRRQYSLRGTETIQHFFGDLDLKTGRFDKLSYNEDGVPVEMGVPDISPNEKGVYWFELGQPRTA